MKSFKEMYVEKTSHTETQEKSRIEEYMRKLGISGAGPVPESLLARQDLECGMCGKCENCMAIKSMFDTSNEIFQPVATKSEIPFTLHKSKKDVIKAVFEGTEMQDLILLDTFMGHDIYINPDMRDSDGHKVGCHFVMGHDMSWQAFMSMEEAQDYISSIFKGAVETTGKELIDMAMEAKHADVPTDNIVENIKNIQIKRQKATIAAREKEEGTTKSFKEAWSPISKEWDAK